MDTKKQSDFEYLYGYHELEKAKEWAVYLMQYEIGLLGPKTTKAHTDGIIPSSLVRGNEHAALSNVLRRRWGQAAALQRADPNMHEGPVILDLVDCIQTAQNVRMQINDVAGLDRVNNRKKVK